MASYSSGRSGGFGKQIMVDGVVAVPAVATSLATKLSYVYQVFVSNPTNAQVSITVTDDAGTTILVPTTLIPANYPFLAVFPEGVPVVGVKWNAGATGCYGEIFGYTHS